MAQTRSRARGKLRNKPTAAPSATDGAPGEEHAVWVAHDKALARTREAAEAGQRMASTAAKQRAAAESLADRAHAVAARAQELATSFTRITDAFERLGLVALNAGLEGARLGEVAGRALLLVSDEVREQAVRGSDSARELSTTLTEVGAEITRLHAIISQARQTSGDASQEAALVAAASGEAERALVEIGARIRKATGNDPETVRVLAVANEQARGLMTSLATLDGTVARAQLLHALGPALEPLARLLAERGRSRSEKA